MWVLFIKESGSVVAWDAQLIFATAALIWGITHLVNVYVSSDIQTTNIYDFDKRKWTKFTGPDVSLKLSENCQNMIGMAAQMNPARFMVCIQEHMRHW